MKNPIERKRTEYVCGNIVMNSGTTAITGFTVQDDEDYKISDAWIVSTANTEYPLENKTIKKYGFKEIITLRTCLQSLYVHYFSEKMVSLKGT